MTTGLASLLTGLKSNIGVNEIKSRPLRRMLKNVFSVETKIVLDHRKI